MDKTIPILSNTIHQYNNLVWETNKTKKKLVNYSVNQTQTLRKTNLVNLTSNLSST
jgi:hypothetical protein